MEGRPAGRRTRLAAGLAALLAGAAAAAPAGAADELTRAVQADLPSLVALYQDLHRHPELAFQEVRTARRMAEQLRELGFEVTESVGRTGVVGVLAHGEGPTILVRTDMDALPVREETGLPYASTATARQEDGTEVPVMHACGHDLHMAIWVGVARHFARTRGQWQGRLVFVAQPAEETGEGAKAMLDDGLYQRFGRPQFALALHDSPALPAGVISYTPGYAMANVDSVDVRIRGVGGHGAYPALTKDPIVLAAHTITAWQTLVSREIDPQKPAVVTVGAIEGGTAHNIIGEEVRMKLTVRSYEAEVRERLLAGIRRIAEGEARALGLPQALMPEVRVKENFTPAVFNTPRLTRLAADAWTARFGRDRVIEGGAVMGGEDFSRYRLADPTVESLLFWVGAVNPQRFAEARGDISRLPGLHSPLWAPDAEPSIATGVEAMVVAVEAALSPAARQTARLPRHWRGIQPLEQGAR